MENTSKALLIAGAILIVILLIAVGMLVYSQSRGVIDTGVAQMSSAEINIFNAQFKDYEGIQQAKATVSLLQQIRNNNVMYKDDKSKWVEVLFVTTHSIPGYENRGYNINTSSYNHMIGFFDKYIPFIDQNSSINNKGNKRYDIAFEYVEGLIKKVVITQVK